MIPLGETEIAVQSGLIAAINTQYGGSLTASASSYGVQLTSKQPGYGTNWPVGVSYTSSNPLGTSPAESSYSPTATNMAGGVTASSGASSGSSYTTFIYTPHGTRLATLTNGSLVSAKIPLPGGGVAMYNASGLSYIRHSDWLGSSRLATTWSHSVYSKTAYAPFGETYNTLGNPDASFTGEDADPSSGYFNFLYRKFDSVAGRWTSPDPSGLAHATLSNPQSLNRYAYVLNNPLANIDPNGLDCVYLTDDSSGVENVDPGTCDAGSGGYYVPGTYNGQALQGSDGSIVGFESMVGGTGYVSQFFDDGSVGLATMPWWELPSVGSNFNGGLTMWDDATQEQAGLQLSLAGQTGGWIGTWQGIGTVYAASAAGGSMFSSFLGAGAATTLGLEAPAATSSSFALSNAYSLESFAESVGSETYLDYPDMNWQEVVQQKLMDPDVTVNVNLSGIDNAFGYIQQTSGYSGFAWELNLIREGVYEGAIQFYSDGAIVGNPFSF